MKYISIVIFLLAIVTMTMAQEWDHTSWFKNSKYPVAADHTNASPDQTPASGSNSTPFDAHDQLVDVNSVHEFIHPGPKDARGPCPALNTLANHGYISHDGVTNFDELRDALVDVFTFDVGMAEFFLWHALAASGSADMWTLSIGGHHPRTELNATYNLTGPTRGLSGTHVNFETDGSPTRWDLYDPRSGDPDDVNMNIDFFKQLYDRQAGVADDEVDYNLTIVTQHKLDRILDSIKNNPDMFMSPSNAVIGSTVSYLLISNVLANHSAEKPDGRLDRETLKSFFAVTEDHQGGLQYTPGAEQIPCNWYRRHSSRPYTIQDLNEDIRYMFTRNPDLLNKYFVGGNSNSTAGNWVSLDIEKMSGGNYTLDSILSKPNHPICFAVASGPEFTAPYIKALYKDVVPVYDLLDEKVVPLTKPLNCPHWYHLDYSLFDDLKGYKMSLTWDEER